MTFFIGRREFITLLGSAAATAWPLGVRAQACVGQSGAAPLGALDDPDDGRYLRAPLSDRR